MATQQEFLLQIWKEVINAPLQERWIDNVIASADRTPDGPFADLGPVLKRLLQSGASRRDLSLLHRFASYEAVFQTLYILGDPGIDDNDIEMMHESLLGSDPSGKEGRPGSAPDKSC
jgi:hypothetical protein